jgi:hypothetical protein
MRLACSVLVAALCCSGCGMISRLWPRPAQPPIQWPTSEELAGLQPVTGEFSGEVAVVAAAAIQQCIRDWKAQGLFEGCPTPATGLGVTVYQWKGTYYVSISERFDRCGRSRSGMLDWWEVFAVSPEGEVLGRDPFGY